MSLSLYYLGKINIDFSEEISGIDILDILKEAENRYKAKKPDITASIKTDMDLTDERYRTKTILAKIEPREPDNWRDIIMSQAGIKNVRLIYFCRPHG